MSESSSESFLPYKAAYDNYHKDIEEICAISGRLVASAEGVEREPITDTAKLAKLKSIKSQMLKLRETRNEARNRFDTAIDALNAKSVQDIRGLCAYAEGTGQSSAGIRYLIEECKSFDAAKGDFKLRSALRSQIVDVLANVADSIEKQKGIVSADTSVLARFEALEGEDASAFYHKHKETIRVQLQARQDAANQP